MAKMTVSQTLRAIADLKGKLKSHKEHAQASVLYFEANKPAFHFETEMKGFEEVRTELLRLKTALTVANATTFVEWNGKPVLVAWAIRYLEELKGHKPWVEALQTAPEPEKMEDNFVNQYVNGVVSTVNQPRKKVCKMTEATRFETAHKLQEEFNRLNDLVETSNHQTFVPEV